jgi:hypothetical protein
VWEMGSGCDPSVVTQLVDLANHVPPSRTKSATVEGHVPKGVEVQVLSSALQAVLICWILPDHVPGGYPFRHMVFVMYP